MRCGSGSTGSTRGPADLLRSRLAAATLKAEFEQALGALPDGPAKPGEPWERTEVVDGGAGMELVLRKKYEYAGTEKRGGKTLDKITAKVIDAKYRQDADSSSPLKLTKSDLKVNSSEATILFDREAGCIVESHERIELKGNLTLSAEGQDQPCRVRPDDADRRAAPALVRGRSAHPRPRTE